MIQVDMNGDEDELVPRVVESAGSRPSPEDLLQRQQILVERAKELQKHYGDPVARLAELLSTLLPDDDPFWLEILETDDM